jgi:drug/metabolite transporter superfamily protein YnfA
LSLPPGPAARIYDAYGSVYITVALAWLVESQRPTRWDIIGATVSLIGRACQNFRVNGIHYDQALVMANASDGKRSL